MLGKRKLEDMQSSSEAIQSSDNRIEYKFNSKEDLAFYILNAVCHDWVHDFNSYDRLAKIVDYIMSIVPPSSAAKKDTLSTGIVYVAASEDLEPRPLVFGSHSAAAVDSESAAAVHVSSKMEVDETPQGVVDAALPDDFISTDLLPTETDDDDDDVRKVTVKDQYEALVDEYLNPVPTDDVSITGLNAHQALVATSINLYNKLESNTQPDPYMRTRGNDFKIYILQKLSDFIGEVKFLVISKLSDVYSMFTRMRGSRQRGGSNGINVITKEDIVMSIDVIIEEINNTENLTTKNKETLESIFNFIKEIYLNFEIPGISHLETFNNSLIDNALSMFIVNQCKYIDIKTEALLYLEYLIPKTTSTLITTPELSTISTKSTTYTPSSISSLFQGQLSFEPTNRQLVSTPAGGGPFSQKVYINEPSRVWLELDRRISAVHQLSSLLFQSYTQLIKVDSTFNYQSAYHEYLNFITGLEREIVLITGPQLYNSRTKQIKNKYDEINPALAISYRKISILIDLINNFLYDQIIKVYEDIKNKSKFIIVKSVSPTSLTSTTSPKPKLPGEAIGTVQNISRLVAYKVLELTGYLNIPSDGNATLNTSLFNRNKDLALQAQILYELLYPVSTSIYTKVDDKLIYYFIGAYGRQKNFLLGKTAIDTLIAEIKLCKGRKQCRLINNAISSGPLKDSISNIVVCPTSSVCDAMGMFGSCLKPKDVEKEYFNMDFYIDAVGDEGNFYTGQTTLKDNRGAVNINYGIKFEGLEIYNFIDMDIKFNPKNLELTNSFKGVINRIIEIWKLASRVTSIDGLWDILYDTQYVTSIIKLGSQKAVGDIFQEINSTLANGGYNRRQVTGVQLKKTFGLMGDRPSGVRVIKLLKDAYSGVLNNVYGGFIGVSNALIYNRPIINYGKRMAIGGKKTLKKLKAKKYTIRHKKYINKSNKKRKYKMKKTKKN